MILLSKFFTCILNFTKHHYYHYFIQTSFRFICVFIPCSSVQFSSVTQLCPTPCDPRTSLSITNSQGLLKLLSIKSVMPSNHLIVCRILLPSIFPSIRVFSNESLLCIRWPKYCSFSFSTSNEYSGLTSLELIALISLLSKGLSRVFFSTIVLKHWFFSTQPSLWSNSHICTWLLEKPWLWLYEPLSAKWCICFLIFCLGLYSFSSKEQASFNFIAVVTVHSDFGA